MAFGKEVGRLVIDSSIDNNNNNNNIGVILQAYIGFWN